MIATLRPALAVLGAAFLSLIVGSSASRAELRLYMFEKVGCIYCKRWHEEVGDAYDKTDEGRLAPLVRVQLTDPLPDGLTVASPPVFTPTFVLASDGREVGRIEGYPGEDFFWGLLGVMLAATDESKATAATN
jgi:hypothetical protein